MIGAGDMRLAAELFAISVETNCEVEGMKASNVAARIVSAPIPFGREKFLNVLARHEARVDRAKLEAQQRTVRDPGEIRPADFR